MPRQLSADWGARTDAGMGALKGLDNPKFGNTGMGNRPYITPQSQFAPPQTRPTTTPGATKPQQGGNIPAQGGSDRTNAGPMQGGFSPPGGMQPQPNPNQPYITPQSQFAPGGAYGPPAGGGQVGGNIPPSGPPPTQPYITPQSQFAPPDARPITPLVLPTPAGGGGIQPRTPFIDRAFRHLGPIQGLDVHRQFRDARLAQDNDLMKYLLGLYARPYTRAMGAAPGNTIGPALINERA